MDTTGYLGFVIGPDGLRMDTPKIQVILDCPAPGCPIVLGFRKLLQTVYRLVLRYHRPTGSAYAQGRPVGLVSAM